MLTEDGAAATRELIHGYLEGAVIRVFRNQEEWADAPLDEGFPVIRGDEVVVQATFGEDVANFTWRFQAVMVGGKAFDYEPSEQGEKVAGSVWSLEIALKPEA
jgi:hypothetical protein